MLKSFLLILMSVVYCNAQFNEKLVLEKIKLSTDKPINETLLVVGKSFLGLPYEGGTLEGPEEKLICKIDAFDCYTFVENVLAISLCSKTQGNYDDYTDYLTELRYRNGEIDGYESRIHYFFDWVKNAEKNNIVKDLSPILGIKNDKKINFMSQNRRYYPSFAKDDTILGKIIEMEKNLEKYPFYYIPQEEFTKYESAIKNGDIIAFTSTKAGLDVNHEGFAIWQNNKLHLMHASLDFKKVIISTETLEQYLKRIKTHSGVMVVRVNEITSR